MASIHSAKYITKLDMNSAYHQLQLHPEVRELTTFVLPGGSYRFKKAPYGLADVPGSFQKMMDMICAGCDGVLNYLDDVIVTADTEEEHDARLRRILKKFQHYGLTLNREKCTYKVHTLDWLGATISEQGVQMSAENTEAVKNLHTPENQAELRSVLGLFQYFSKFLPDFASEVAPLRALLKANSTQLTWTENIKTPTTKLRTCY